MLPITALFAGIFTLFFVRLALNVIRLRHTSRVALGSGGVADLEGAMRAHGNFAEYVPVGIILLGLLESTGHHMLFVIIPGVVLLVGRLIHAKALHSANIASRVRGMKFTFSALIAMAGLNIAFAAMEIFQLSF
jgi:uncharacterized membrane protein YecN with MAPEG domain